MHTIGRNHTCLLQLTSTATIFRASSWFSSLNLLPSKGSVLKTHCLLSFSGYINYMHFHIILFFFFLFIILFISLNFLTMKCKCVKQWNRFDKFLISVIYFPHYTYFFSFDLLSFPILCFCYNLYKLSFSLHFFFFFLYCNFWISIGIFGLMLYLHACTKRWL